MVLVLIRLLFVCVGSFTLKIMLCLFFSFFSFLSSRGRCIYVCTNTYPV